MRLKQVTLTGIDQRTDLIALQELQREYPFAMSRSAALALMHYYRDLPHKWYITYYIHISY